MATLHDIIKSYPRPEYRTLINHRVSKYASESLFSDNRNIISPQAIKDEGLEEAGISRVGARCVSQASQRFRREETSSRDASHPVADRTCRLQACSEEPRRSCSTRPYHRTWYTSRGRLVHSGLAISTTAPLCRCWTLLSDLWSCSTPGHRRPYSDLHRQSQPRSLECTLLRKQPRCHIGIPSQTFRERPTKAGQIYFGSLRGALGL